MRDEFSRNLRFNTVGAIINRPFKSAKDKDYTPNRRLWEIFLPFHHYVVPLPRPGTAVRVYSLELRTMSLLRKRF